MQFKSNIAQSYLLFAYINQLVIGNFNVYLTFAPQPNTQVNLSRQIFPPETNMKKSFSLLVTGFLVVGSFGCQEAFTSNTGTTQAPVKEATEGKTIKSTVKETATPTSGTNAKDKTQTKKTITTQTEGGLKAAVSKKLQAGIPGNKFIVENAQGEITLKGVASSQGEIEKAENLVREVKGVKSVKVEAKIEPASRS